MSIIRDILETAGVNVERRGPQLAELMSIDINAYYNIVNKSTENVRLKDLKVIAKYLNAELEINFNNDKINFKIRYEN